MQTVTSAENGGTEKTDFQVPNTVWSWKTWKVLMSFNSEFNLLDLTLQYDNNAQNPNLSDYDAPSGPVFLHFV